MVLHFPRMWVTPTAVLVAPFGEQKRREHRLFGLNLVLLRGGRPRDGADLLCSFHRYRQIIQPATDAMDGARLQGLRRNPYIRHLLIWRFLAVRTIRAVAS